MQKKPITTLFLLTSLDGKISTGATDLLDMDTDLAQITGVKEGLHQYYEIEQTTDLWSLNSGRVQAKMGVNTKELPSKTPVSFVIIDNKNLTLHGVQYFCELSKNFVLVTANKEHPAYDMHADNLHIIYQPQLDLSALLECLYEKYQCERITIQTGGTLNGMFLREKMLDYVDIVIAPVLVGGQDTATLVDGVSLMKPQELDGLGALQLIQSDCLEDSYVRLRYKVIGGNEEW